MVDRDKDKQTPAQAARWLATALNALKPGAWEVWRIDIGCGRDNRTPEPAAFAQSGEVAVKLAPCKACRT